MRVRLMRDDETEAVSALVTRAYARDFDLTEQYLASIGDIAGRSARGEVWVAVDEQTGGLVGTVTTPREGSVLSDVAREGELDFRFLGVAASARGRGVGEVLVRHVLSIAASRGIRRVVLNTGPMMVAAQRLYERLGFERLGDREYEFVRDDGTTFLMMAYGIDVAEPALSAPLDRARGSVRAGS